MTEFHVDRDLLYKSRAQTYAREWQIDERIEQGQVKYRGRLSWATTERSQAFETALAAWIDSGRQSFFLAPGLAERLDHTDLRGAPMDALRTPYSTMWIEGLPDIVGMANHKDILGGVLVIHEPAHAPCEKGLDVCSHKRVLWVFVVYEHWLKALADVTLTHQNIDDMMSTQMFHDVAKRRDSRKGFWTGFKIQRLLVELDAPTIEECVERSLKAIHAKEATGRTDVWDGKPLNPDGMDDDVVRRLVSFVANFCLYLSTPDPDYQRVVPPHLERHVKCLDRLNSHGKKHGQSWRVGQRLTRIYAPQEGQEYEEPPESGEKRHVRKHLVRGFWRNQVWGIGRSQRRLIWIMPHWRGSLVPEGKPKHEERIYVAAEGAKAPEAAVAVAEKPAVELAVPKVEKKILAKQHATYAVTLRDDRDQARKKGVCRCCGTRTGWGTSHDERETLAYCAQCARTVSKKSQEYELWLLRQDWSR